MSGIVRTVDLRMVYHVGKVEVDALRGVDIEVQRGEFVAIVGPSGCGKSTLLHLLGGLARPSAGKIFIDGAEISGGRYASPRRARRSCISQAIAATAPSEIHSANSAHDAWPKRP